MATKNTNVAETPAKKAPTFDKTDIIANAKVFGATPELIAGALTLIKHDKVTRAEVQKALETFRNQPVAARKETK